LKAGQESGRYAVHASQSDFKCPPWEPSEVPGLRTLGIPTQVVIYPGQFSMMITVPHDTQVDPFSDDRWFKKYLK